MRHTYRKNQYSYIKASTSSKSMSRGIDVDISSILAPKIYDKVDEVDDLVFYSDELLDMSNTDSGGEHFAEWEAAFEPFADKLLDKVDEINSELDYIEVVGEIDERENTLILFAIYKDNDDFDEFDDAEFDIIAEDEIDSVNKFLRQLKRTLLS